MRVTEVVPFDKRRSRVFLDGEFAFALYPGDLRRYRIREDAELTADCRGEIEELLYRRAKERALYLLRDRDRTELEVTRKLRQGLYPEPVIERTLAFLREYHFVDDLEYARRYIEFYGGSRGGRWVRSSLMKKGLDREQIEGLFDTGQDTERIAEDSQIRTYLRKKHYDAGSAEPAEKRRLLAALLRRGYSPGAVRRAMETGGESVEMAPDLPD